MPRARWHPLETMRVARAFEERCRNFERLEVSSPWAPGLPQHESLFLWPQETGGNGMFVAAWVRRAAG